jgi:DNA-binding response OmpR family regulator
MAASAAIRTDDSLHILVIEDERKLADAIAEGLAGSGYLVTIAHSGEAGLEEVRDHAIDVVLLDLMLPRQGGLETLRELRRCGYKMPVLILTSKGSIEDRVRGLDAGADDYLIKPFAFPELLARVHVQLGRSDRQRLAAMLAKGREPARVLRRASMLRQLDQGQTAAQVAGNVGVVGKTVRAVARRYEEQGLEWALYEKPRPGKQRALDAGQSQRIVAMVCGSAPERRARWSVRLIAEEAVKRKLAQQVGRETIRILLQTHELKPWREKMWCVAKLNKEYVARM